MSTMSPWDPISPGSSRRSSEAGAGARMSPAVSHHLSKLHKKALAAGTNSSLAQVMIVTISPHSVIWSNFWPRCNEELARSCRYNSRYFQSHSSMSIAGDLMSSGFMDGRNSAMSEVGAQVEDAQGRRMSDPVRPLDRNFGVGGQLSRHRSFGNLQGNQRQSLHHQRVRGQPGQAGGFMEQPGQQTDMGDTFQELLGTWK